MNSIKRLLMLLALIPMTAVAEQVSVDRARTVAESFLTRSLPTRTAAPQLTLRWTGEQIATRTAGEPAFYVFENAGGGFVIVAGDDSVEPVLGYSHESGFDPDRMPDNLREWMKSLQRFIFNRRAANARPTTAVTEQWKNGGIVKASYTPVQHETAKWDQEEPYNALCPKVDGGKTMTGCVATAAAIIMRWHKWPEAGTGTLPGYEYTSDRNRKVTVDGYALGHKYDWDNMPLEYTGKESEAQKAAVAQLMYDCGVMSFMQYNPQGSGAYSSDAAAGLYNYMHYDKTATVMLKCTFHAPEWMRMLRDNIRDYGPTMYDGYSEKDGGHCFVLDGYDAAGRFHINFGWSGYYNGFFTFPDFDTFVLDHSACMGLKKDEGGEETPYMIMMEYDFGKKSGGYYHGMELVNGSFQTEFSLKVGAFYCDKGAFKGQIGVAHTDRSGIFKEVLPSLWFADDEDTEGLPAGYLTAYPEIGQTVGGEYGYYFSFDKPVEPGDKIIMVSRNSESDQWTAIPYDVETGTFIGEIELMGDDNIESNSTFAFDKATRTITVTAPSGAEVSMRSAGGAEVEVTGGNGTFTIKTAQLAAGSYTLRIENGSDSKEIELKIDNKQ